MAIFSQAVTAKPYLAIAFEITYSIFSVDHIQFEVKIYKCTTIQLFMRIKLSGFADFIVSACEGIVFEADSFLRTESKLFHLILVAYDKSTYTYVTQILYQCSLTE